MPAGMLARVGAHFFIDETKAKGFVLVAARCAEPGLAALRQEVGRLVLPGQRSVHMKTEGDRRRRYIADAMAALSVDVLVMDASAGSAKEHERRARAMLFLLGRTTADDRLVFGRDATMERYDRDVLGRVPASRRPSHVHCARHQEPLLAVPDVIAWCWARGGPWRRRLAPLNLTVQEV